MGQHTPSSFVCMSHKRPFEKLDNTTLQNIRIDSLVVSTISFARSSKLSSISVYYVTIYHDWKVLYKTWSKSINFLSVWWLLDEKDIKKRFVRFSPFKRQRGPVVVRLKWRWYLWKTFDKSYFTSTGSDLDFTLSFSLSFTVGVCYSRRVFHVAFDI